jgi:hypothetical protein
MTGGFSSGIPDPLGSVRYKEARLPQIVLFCGYALRIRINAGTQGPGTEIRKIITVIAGIAWWFPSIGQHTAGRLLRFSQ